MARWARHGCRLGWFLTLGLAVGLEAGPALAAQADSATYVVVRLAPDGQVLLAQGSREVFVRLLGLALDAPGADLETLLKGKTAPVLQPGGAVTADGTPLVELHRGGVSLNEAAVRHGLARVDTQARLAPRLKERLQIAEREAREAGRGLWAPRLADQDVNVETAAAPTPAPPAPEPAPGHGPGPTWEAARPAFVDRPPTPPEAAKVVANEPAVAERASFAPGVWPRNYVAWMVPEDGRQLAILGSVHVLCAGLGGWVASQKRRRLVEGLVLGAGFGPLGALVEALLPVPPERRGRDSSSLSRPKPTVARGMSAAAPAPVSSAALPVVPRSLSPLAQYVAANSGVIAPGAGAPGALGSRELLLAANRAVWEHDEDVPADPSLMQDDDVSTASGASGGSSVAEPAAAVAVPGGTAP